MFTTSAYACDDGSSPMKLATIKRRDPGPRDVEIEIEFCGVCHSDIHTARSEWPGSLYPCVPGHEIIGRVGRVGSQVTRFKAGDRVGVGCIVDSCRECASCAEGLEQYCENGMTGTYNSPDKAMGGGAHTLGGYSAHVVVDDRYVLNIPEGLDPAAAAPCSARVSPPIRRCATGMPDPASVSASSVLAVLAIWPSSSPTPWAQPW